MTQRADGADALIVGSGAGGCVVARRLAENSSRSVVLVEAGPDLRSAPPADFADGWLLPKGFDWGFESELDASGGTQPIRRMRAVGGTSWLTRFALRGGRAQYDAWEAAGADGWGYEDCLPVLRQIENDLEFGDRPEHGDAGPIPITRYPAVQPIAAHQALIDAAVATGAPAVEDLNAEEAIGVGRFPMSSRNGTRVAAATAYLGDSAPSNIEVRSDAPVDAVTFEGGRAMGVRLADGSTIRSDRVIVCAGTVGSPLVLMRSGIGPAEDLRRLGIAVRVDLGGVGANLADHAGTDVGLAYDGPTRATPFLNSAVVLRSSAADPGGRPDLLLWISDPRGTEDGPLLEISVILMTPASRGSVALRSADPADPPRIRLPGLREANDVERMIEGIERADEIATHSITRAAVAAGTRSSRLSPEDIRAIVRDTLWSYPHIVGTCAMGQDPADGAVVGPDGHVFGTEGLYVADASVIPIPPSGFTHLPTLMVAERVAAGIAAS
jgi:choline dehydrogenase-like flavoprotein